MTTFGLLLLGGLSLQVLGSIENSRQAYTRYGHVHNGQHVQAPDPRDLMGAFPEHKLTDEEEKMVWETMKMKGGGPQVGVLMPKPRDMLFLHKKMDRDNSGRVDYNEMIQWAEKAYLKGVEEEAKAFIWEMMGPKATDIPVEKVLDYWRPPGPYPHDLVKYMIMTVDENMDYKLDQKELFKLFNEWHEPLLKERVDRTMKDLDKDGDGMISVKDHPVDHVSKKGKEISTEELHEIHEAFEHLDENKDQVLTKNEIWGYESGHWNLHGAIKHLFKTCDADLDQGVSAKEMTGVLYDHKTLFENDNHAEWLHSVMHSWMKGDFMSPLHSF